MQQKTRRQSRMKMKIMEEITSKVAALIATNLQRYFIVQMPDGVSAVYQIDGRNLIRCYGPASRKDCNDWLYKQTASVALTAVAEELAATQHFEPDVPE